MGFPAMPNFSRTSPRFSIMGMKVSPKQPAKVARKQSLLRVVIWELEVSSG
jgi:hypothetical protein